MSVEAQKKAAVIVASTVAAGIAIVGIVTFIVLGYPNGHPSGPPKKARVVVEKGLTLREIARRLADKGLIDHPSWFRFYANERGLAQKIRAGDYELTSAMSPKELLDRLVEGVPVEEIAVTIPEGKNMEQVAEILGASGICSAADALKVMRDAGLARSLGVPNATFEGYLYPDTYRFRAGTSALKVVTQMVKHGHDVLAALMKEHADGVAMLKKQYNFDEREIVLMASLVEKETARTEERPRIAGVFLNRLRLPTFVPHLLQTDPTIVYGCTVPVKKSAACQKFEGRIRRAQLDDKDNPYNTYTHEGLPPGPISNPGRAALLAVLAPDETPYLYFVSKNDGTHYFSKTRAEHEAAVNKYQRNN
ncbi:MAG TPA: endolytic transglycosylase MltG [Polyangia bacterium]|nr:endolytic transglycosylase MltG [Polyangia bacterium]